MKASIIIPTYNYARYITRAIETVMAQLETPGQIEVIVVDDGSTDNTATVIQHLQQQYPHLQYHVQPNAGKAVATQKGISLATGDIIFTLDADDWLLPGKIAETISIFARYPTVVHVASAALIHWQDGHRPNEPEPIPTAWLGKPLQGEELLRHYYTHNQLFGGGSTFACRASVLKAMPLPTEVDMYTDEWLVMHALLAGDSYFHPQPLSVWQIHNNNYSGKGGEAQPQKQARYLQASATVLHALETGNYPAWLCRAYRLKHALRSQYWLEQAAAKTLADRWHFLRHTLLSGHYSFGLLWQYKAFNRLLK